MPNTFDLDPDTLPPVTKAIRQTWIQPGPNQPSAPYPSPQALSAILDAVHNLELRVIDLET